MRKFIKHILFWANLFVALALIASLVANFLNPIYFWPFAFFGLAFPLLLIINIGFLIFWLWRRKWILFMSLIALVAGWPNVKRYVQFEIFHEKAEKPIDLKVLSYNVRLFNHYQWDKREGLRDSILTFVNAQQPDVICFQDFLTVAGKHGATEKYTHKQLAGYSSKYLLYTYKSGKSFRYGLATYSKYPIVSRGSLQFNKSSNSCIYTDIKIDDDTIRVYNVHLQSVKFRKNYYYFADSLTMHFNSNRMEEAKDIYDHLRVAFIKRAEQVDELEQHIRRSPYPVVVCGDFNDTPVSYTYERFRPLLDDSFIRSGRGIGYTYRGNLSSFRIDYILHSKAIQSGGYQTYPIDFSDHYPLSCGITLGK